jgi:hypothetical protein
LRKKVLTRNMRFGILFVEDICDTAFLYYICGHSS